ncbi:MAG TPA: hypothetical protein VKQ29_08020 [Aliidongia sp.]|nr:hypothetical protein [Aliidongia sp.]
MRGVRLTVTTTMVVGIGFIAMTTATHADYIQVSCEIDNDSDYAAIWVEDDSKIERHPYLRYNIQFAPGGIAVRMLPQFYGQDWAELEDIEMRYDHRESEFGLLQLRLHDTGHPSFIQTVGRVKRPCWNAVKKYIREHIESKGTVVHISETTAK